MCKLKSGIILKNRVFVPEYDSHTEMLEELGIKDDYLNASKTFVRVELSPTDGDVFSDIDTWKLNVDQDIMPEWYDEDIYKPQVVEAVKEWAKDHIHIGVDNLKISTGRNHCIKDCKDVDICGSAMVKYIHGNATVEYICGNATVENICGSATVKYIYGNATVEYIHSSATVENIFGNTTVENIFGSATVKKAKGLSVIFGNQFGWDKKDLLTLEENATFKDCQTKTIYQSGDWKLVSVENKNKV